MGERVTLEASVAQITFRNESNGWTVMQLSKGHQYMPPSFASLPRSPDSCRKIR